MLPSFARRSFALAVFAAMLLAARWFDGRTIAINAPDAPLGANAPFAMRELARESGIGSTRKGWCVNTMPDC